MRVRLHTGTFPSAGISLIKGSSAGASVVDLIQRGPDWWSFPLREGARGCHARSGRGDFGAVGDAAPAETRTSDVLTPRRQHH